MQRKIYHRRGMKPKREIIASVDGRLHPEQAYTIVRLYMLDKLSISDIARLYGTSHKCIGNLIKRERARMQAPEPDGYMLKSKLYAMALKQLDVNREISCKDVAAPLGLSVTEVKRIALRNGLGRK